MEYTSELLIDFIKNVITFDKNCFSAMRALSDELDNRHKQEEQEWDSVRKFAKQLSTNYMTNRRVALSDYQKEIDNVFITDLCNKNNIFIRLQRCNDLLAMISCAENSIVEKEIYEMNQGDLSREITYNIDDVINGKIDFINLVYELNNVIKNGKKKDVTYYCRKFYTTCRVVEKILKKEIIELRSVIIQNRTELHEKYKDIRDVYIQKSISEWISSMEKLSKVRDDFIMQKKKSVIETKKIQLDRSNALEKRLCEYQKSFFSKFPPTVLKNEYLEIYSKEASYVNYKCCDEIPSNVHIGTLEYDGSTLGLSDYTKSFLEKYYYFLFRNEKFYVPYNVSFGTKFNYLFKFDSEERHTVIENACELGMRLFMMFPPGKLNFTFVDPVTLGESFAMFTRLVDVDDRTSEVINGKIWSSPSDIEKKLKVMTDHISNVTQRCLQGKYNNIYEYNCIAEQNAEPYQILMLMDFPAGFTDQSLKLLEQIVASGPKCGVFTIIYRNEKQYKKIPERSYPLISNIESGFQIFNYNQDCTQIIYDGKKIKGNSLLWENIHMPNNDQMNQIIDILKKGIKNADKVVIDIDKFIDKDNNESTYTTKDGIRIPIGIRGAKEVQYLTLGVGGSHHALIAGVAGSGKSSLLHTIILRMLTQYSPNELSIYLVDFKRGVEFKIYADFQLPAFKVIAIESEREFGYNILLALEREQKIRADLFKKSHVDKIEEYRDPNLGGKKMPRIVVIMDEFHELFSDVNDEFAKKSAIIMERIVRQGRAFGVHLILASQSYSNISGINRAVFDQMAVRIVLKCSKADANLLLDNGSTEIDQISIDDPGRAVYNSEAGNKEYNSHFRVAYIAPEKHRDMLQEISDKTISYADKPTRILLSNIEDNRYCIFNQFTQYTPDMCNTPGRLHIGELLSVDNNLYMELTRTEYSNMLMIGSDSDKARSMFAFTMLSLAINYWVSHNQTTPTEPFIYFLNYKPLRDSYFIDAPGLLAKELLTQYVCNIPVNSSSQVKQIIQRLYEESLDNSSENGISKYLMVFGYQRAEDLKSDEKEEKRQDILSMMSVKPQGPSYSTKEMLEIILTQGSRNGVHVIFWQDDFKALDIADRKLITYFYQKIAFDMSKEDFSQFVGVNDISHFSENTAVYDNRIDDIQSFRPYQSPDRNWMEGICEQLNKNRNKK